MRDTRKIIHQALGILSILFGIGIIAGGIRGVLHLEDELSENDSVIWGYLEDFGAFSFCFMLHLYFSHYGFKLFQYT